jgi:hypothetical protein
MGTTEADTCGKYVLPKLVAVIDWLDRLQGEIDALARFQTETGVDIDALLPAIVGRVSTGSADDALRSSLTDVVPGRVLREDDGEGQGGVLDTIRCAQQR